MNRDYYQQYKYQQKQYRKEQMETERLYRVSRRLDDLHFQSQRYIGDDQHLPTIDRIKRYKRINGFD